VLWLRTRWQNDRPIVRRLLFFGVAWYGITIAPMVVTYQSARHLYVTAAGISIALASLLLPAGWRSAGWSRIARPIAIGLLVIASCASLILNMRPWRANGVDALRYTAALPRLLNSLPAGSTIFIDIPDMRRGVWLGAYALPFALEQPFLPEDLYRRFAVVEWPLVYCCPATQWWEAKQAALAPILQATESQEVAYIMPDPRDEGSLIMNKRTISGASLRPKIESAVGKPIEALDAAVTHQEAQRVAEILFE